MITIILTEALSAKNSEANVFVRLFLLFPLCFYLLNFRLVPIWLDSNAISGKQDPLMKHLIYMLRNLSAIYFGE